MQQIKELFKQEKKLEKSERSEIIKQIFSLYDTDFQTNLLKKENWKRYVNWLKSDKILNTKEAQNKFKRTKLYIRKMSVNSMVYFLSPIKTKDLYYILSVSKDRNTRGQSVGSFIISSIWKIK